MAKKLTRKEKSKRNKKAYAAVRRTDRGTPKPVRGKSPVYSEELMITILERVSNGETVKGVCRALDINESTIRSWLISDRGADPNTDPPTPGLFVRYARARELQAEAWADGTVEIADTATPAGVNKAKLRVDVRRWLMGKNHIRFADKSTVVMEGNADAPVQTVNRTMTEAEAAAAYEATRKQRK